MFYRIKINMLAFLRGITASIFLCFLPFILNAQVKEQASITVETLSVNSSQSNWLLSTQGTIILNKQQYNVLMDGIDITFIYEIEVNQIREYIWDRNILSKRIKRELSIHSLSNQFVVRDSVSKQLETFLTLELALKFIARLDDIVLEKTQENNQDNSAYQGRLRLYLDIESLPIPMRLPAYLKDDWFLIKWLD